VVLGPAYAAAANLPLPADAGASNTQVSQSAHCTSQLHCQGLCGSQTATHHSASVDYCTHRERISPC
jgi:hypothetical protein